ncbi:hypothetical protein KPL71_014018 [Citrus sinensis]|uniref:Uncharacterized protein n=1 Tax=Citrus sinensis TaxID=2711 RepID=A0ACB8K8U9_CITSI|nr:hypothetical protein KPL71_014018 [Citrus sinensis]
MADAIVSTILEQLISFAAEEIKQQVKLVVGVEKEVKSLTSHLQAIQVVLDDAEEKQVKEKAVSLWLGRLKYASYDIEDVLDEWITTRRKLQIEGGIGENALVVPHKKKKVCLCFPGSCFGFKQEEFGFKQVFLRHDIADKIKEINEELHDIAAQKDMFDLVKSGNKSSERPRRVQSTFLIDEEEICGRVGERNELLSKLLCESSEQQKGLHIISIVGMGGIGKTTLAQLACNHDEVKRKFDKILWVCVSETFEEFRVAKAIVEVLDGRESHLAEFHSLLQHIYESIAGKSFLLVLDDVWDGNYLKWEPFYRCLKNGLHGSKILVTTRKGSVASMMGSIDIISVKELAEEECWLLFNKIAFFDRSIEEREKLEQIGQRIAGKCKGLPLAAKTIGSLMRSKQTEEEWKRILNSDLWKVEEIEKDVLSSLLLSYNDLPSRVKRCFSYCAVFPKDYNIEKDKLITLWMAQGYLSAEEDEEMETVGEEYFGILASRSFFQEFKKSYDNRIIECKMHDMVHDFARFVSQNECFSMAINGSEEPNATNSLDEKVRHLMLIFSIEASLPVSTCRVKRIRSLLINDSRSDHSLLNGEILEELFRELTSLRALDFCKSYNASWSSTLEIPRNIEKLVHLRYLNLSYQGIKKLPETLCELYNLEKLDISYCYKLEELPEGIGKLINMKHLRNRGTSSLRYMPVGIGRLTGLRTLGEFHVSAGGGVDGRKACRLESLKNLEHLQVCGICRLGDVSDVGEAKRLELDKKKYLFSLTLEFDKTERGGERRKNEDDQLLLEALRPPLDLKELEIRYYRGNTVFPSWMASLTNLKSLHLHRCENCEQLPPLGKLPSLENLYIWRMESVKRVGDEFLGIESDHHDSSSSSSVTIAFPKLKSLTIYSMLELEEWDYEITRTGNTVINIMPRLSSLTIVDCTTLKALPDHIHQTTTLKELSIFMCWLLNKRYRKGKGEDWPKISHIPNLRSRAGYEKRSLLEEGLPVTESKEKETISRQLLAVGSEWSPLKKFPGRCTAITIILGLRSCGSFHQPEPGPAAMDNSGSRAGYEMRSSLVEVLPVTEPKENETISRQQLAVAINKFLIPLVLNVHVKQAEQDCGNEKVFSESLNSGLDGSPCYCQESPHVRSCGSFHQPEPEPVVMDNSASFPFVHFGMLSSDSRMYGLRIAAAGKIDDFMAGRVIVLN